MSKKNVEIVHYPSLVPLIIAGVVYCVGTFILPMYKLYSYIILICISIAVYIVLRKMNVFKDEIVEVENNIKYESTELEEICRLGYAQIESLESLTSLIENDELIHEMNQIKTTSESILKMVEDNPILLKKVTKYFKYYLAEIIQLIQKYDEFENDPLNIENVKESKDKIVSTVKNANQVFLKFYNDLYEGKAMDVNVDVKVLEGMLKKLD